MKNLNVHSVLPESHSISNNPNFFFLSLSLTPILSAHNDSPKEFGCTLTVFLPLLLLLLPNSQTNQRYIYSSTMSFKEGSKFPEGVEFTYIPIQLDDLTLIDPTKCQSTTTLKIDDILTKLSQSDESSKLVFVSVPGAFTPTCTESHVPGILENLDKLKSKNVGAIVVLAVNDAFVVNAWGKILIKEYVKQSNNIPEIYFASDGGFSGKYDLAADRGGVFRNKRYAAIVDSKSRDVSYLGVETERGVHVSGVDALLAKL